MKKFKQLIVISLFFLSTGCGLIYTPEKPFASPPEPLEMFKAAPNTPIPGYDVLGVAKYCPVFLQAPKLPGMSTLLNTFGNPLSCIDQRATLGNLKVVQIDLIDATCWRNGNCAPGVPKSDDLKTIEKRARLSCPLVKKWPDIHFELSPALEYDVKSNATVLKMLQAIKKGCPEAEPIESPYSGATPSGYRVERHNTKVSATIVSSDGSSMFDGDNIKNDGNNFQHRIAGKDETYGWFNELNLRCTGEKKFTPPLQRINRPELWQFKVAHKILTTIEDPDVPPPAVCKTVRTFTEGEINKPTAESYCNGVPNDSRGNKPLYIIKKSGTRNQQLPIYSSNGTKVSCAKYYDHYTVPGLFRWYVGSCDGKNAWELYEALGQEWGYLGLGNGVCIRINALRRQNIYR